MGAPVIWIPRSQIVECLRDHNFTFQRRGKKVDIWRQRGGVQRVDLPMCDLFEQDEARNILTQAGLTKKQRDEFVAKAMKDHPN